LPVHLDRSLVERRPGHHLSQVWWLTKANIKRAIPDAHEKGRTALQKRTSQLDDSIERLYLELARPALHDPRKFYNADGSLKQVTEFDDDTAACLGIEHETA
jgi:hypothetical protein